MMILLYHLFSSCSTLSYQLHYFLIYLCPHLLRVRPQILCVPEADKSQPIAHSKFGDDIVSYLVGFLEVVCCPVGTGSIEVLLSAPSS